MSQFTNLGLLAAELLALAFLVLGLHRLSARYGLAPLFVCLGGVAALMQFTSPLGAFVRPFPGLTFTLGSHALVPALLLGMLVIYATSGTTAARLTIYGIVGANVLAFLALASFNLHTSLPGGGNLAGLTAGNPAFTPDLRRVAASTLALIADLYSLALVYQFASNRRAPAWFAAGLALGASLGMDALVFTVICYAGTPDFFVRLPGQVIGKLAAGLLLWPLAGAYVTRAQRRAPQPFAGGRRARDMLFGTLGQVELENTQLGQERRLLQTAVGDMDDGLAVADLDGRILYANPASASMVGLNPAKMIGRSFTEFIAGDDDPAARDRNLSLLMQTGRLDLDIETGAQNGRSLHLAVKAALIRDPAGRPQQIVATLRDITRRVHFEQQLAAVTALTAGLARERDLETLLGRILDEGRAMLFADRAGAYLVDRETSDIIHVVVRGLPDEYVQRVVADYKQDMPGATALRTLQPVAVEDVLNDPAFGERFAFMAAAGFRALVILPMLYQGQAGGALVFYYDEPHIVSEQEIGLGKTLADHAAVAVENARLFEAEARRGAEAETLREVAAILSATTDRSAVLELILDQIKRVMPYDSASVMLVEDEALRIVAASGLRATVQHSFSLTTLVHVQKIFADRLPLIIPDTASDPGWFRPPGTEYIRCWLGVPLIARDRVIGLLNLDKEQPGFYGARDAQLAAAFASHAAIAIENARLLEESQRQTGELAGLYDIALATGSELEIGALLQRLHEQVQQFVAPDTFAAALYHSQTGQLEVALAIERGEAVPGAVGIRMTLDEGGLTGWVMRTRKTLLVDDMDADRLPVPPLHGQHPARSWLGVPLIARDQLIGAISAQSFRAFAFTERDRRFLEALSLQVAIALENSRLFEAARRQVKELTVLRAVAVAGAEAQSEDELIASATRLIGETLYPANFGIMLVDARDNSLRPHPSFAGQPEPSLGAIHPAGQGLAGAVVVSGQPLRVPDVSREPRYIGVNLKTHSELIVPLKVGERVIGVIDVESEQLDGFNERDEQLLVTFAGQLATALEKVRLLQAERQQRELAEALSEAGAALSASLEFEVVLDRLLEQIRRVVPYDAANLMLVREDHIQVARLRGYEQFGEAFQQAVAALSLDIAATPNLRWMAENRQPLIIPDIRYFPGWLVVGPEIYLHSWAGAPIVAQEQVIAFFSLEKNEPDFYQPVHAGWLSAFAGQAALALQNAQLFDAARQRAAELEAVRQATLNLTASLELEPVLDAILESALGLLPGAEGAHIFLYHLEDGGGLAFGAALWAGDRQSQPMAPPRPNGVTATVARRGEPVIVPDMNTHPLFQDGSFHWAGAMVGLPLKIGRRVVGVMNLSYLRPRAFSEAELRTLRLLADQAALAIENASLFQRAASERRHLQVLYDLSRALAATLEPDEILGRAAELTCLALGGLVGEGFVYLPEQHRLSLRALHGRQEENLSAFDLSLNLKEGLGVAGWVALHREAVTVMDVSQEARWLSVSGLDDDVRSVISAPILESGQLLGVLSVLHGQRAVFSADHLSLLEAICQQVGLALGNAGRFQQVQRQLREITVIQQLAQTFNRRLELQQLLDEVVQQVARLLGYPVVEILLVEGEMLVLKACLGHEPDETELSLTKGIIGRAARTGQIEFVPDVSTDPDYVAVAPNTVAEIAVPILRQKTVVGMINVEASRRDQLSAQDSELLKVLADQVSVALENAYLYDRARRHAEELEGTVKHRTAELGVALEAARAADRVKSQFVSDVSHELRTPLSNIILYLGLLAKAAEEKRPGYVETLQREANRLRVIIENLLSISRLDTGREAIRLTPTDLNALAGSLVTDRSYLLAERGLTLKFRPAVQLPRAQAAPDLLMQVLTNLLTNAMNFTRAGGEVTLSTRAQELRGEPFVTVTVRDTGVGIPPDEIEHLFERFFRGQASRETGAPGTGLGLAICHEIIQRHGGRITVESETGQGSVFTVWLKPATTQYS